MKRLGIFPVLRCRGTNARYALDCRRLTSHSSQLCHAHRDQAHIVALLDRAAKNDAAILKRQTAENLKRRQTGDLE